MATKSTIEWTEMTWNPVTGCQKVSWGCKNCYAERMSIRLQAMGLERYRNGFEITLHDNLLEEPLKWLRPRIIFVNSMSDLFHEDVPFNFIRQVFDTMVRAPQHIFQVLTKRSKRLRKVARDLPWPNNVWMGVTVEDEQYLFRALDLQHVPAKVRFLSCEPLIGHIKELPLKRIDWVIVGGESGPGARPIKTEWVESTLRHCQREGVAFFFKQWGGVRKKRTGRTLHGRTYNEFPAAAKRH